MLMLHFKHRAVFPAVTAMALLCLAPALGASEPAPILAEQAGITVADGYARATGPTAKAGAAFMAITNASGTDDVLIAARSGVSDRTELHTHVMEDGVARMVELEDGIPVPDGETVLLERGGLHVMLMGLTGPMEAGADVDLVLVFEQAGEIALSVPVDLERGMGMHGHDGDG